MAGELASRGDAADHQRARLDCDADRATLVDEQDRPVPARGRLEGGKLAAARERDVMNRAERVAVRSEEEGTDAPVVALDQEARRIVDEDVGEPVAFAKRRHDPREL